MKIRRSYSIDEKIYQEFLEYAKRQSINISKFIENSMIKKMKEEKETRDGSK